MTEAREVRRSSGAHRRRRAQRPYVLPAAVVAAVTLIAVSWPPAHSGTRAPVRERWHTWSAGHIFPSALPGTSPSGAGVRYLRAGVATEAPCDRALDPAAARALTALGCLTTLRATYADGTGTYVATAGIAVLADSATAMSSSVARRLGAHGDRSRPRPPSVRPAAFPGGPAERFGDRQYVAGAVAAGYDRYVVLTAAGYADGRPYTGGRRADARLVRLARELADALHRGLTR